MYLQLVLLRDTNPLVDSPFTKAPYPINTHVFLLVKFFNIFESIFDVFPELHLTFRQGLQRRRRRRDTLFCRRRKGRHRCRAHYH